MCEENWGYNILIEELGEEHIVVGWSRDSSNEATYQLNILNNEGIAVHDEISLDLSPSSYSECIQFTNLPDNKLLCTWLSEDGLYAQVIDFTTVDNETNDITSINMNLLQNYPNPFNPETNISFLVPNSGQVHLDIYNIKGQKVTTLVNDRFNAGKPTIIWNGKDDSNKQVASGIYLYKMRSGKYNSTKKMILMK